MNYYEETLEKVKKLVSEKKYEESLKVIENELTLPYVPKDFESQLKEIQNEIYAVIGKPVKPKLSGEQIFTLLNGETISVSEKASLFSQLETINLRSFLSEIQNFIQSENSNELKTILIYLLANQEIDYNFAYQVNDQQVELNPKTFDFKKVETIAVKLNEVLSKILPLDYPQLESMSQVIVASFYYKVFPLLETYDLEKLAQAIKNRLLIVTGIDEVSTDDSQILEYENILMKLEIV